MMVAYIIQNQMAFDGIISFMVFYGLIGVLSGLVNSDFEISKNEITKSNKFFVLGLVCVLMIPIWLYVAYFPSRKTVKTKELFDASVDVRADEYSGLFSGPGSYVINTDLGMMLYELSQNYLRQRDEISENPEFTKAALNELNALLKIGKEKNDSTEYDYRFNLAMAIFQDTEILLSNIVSPDKLENAKYYLDQAIKFSPNNPSAYLIYNKIYLYENDTNNARIMIEKAMSLNPKVKEIHIQRITFEKLFGNKDQYEKAIKEGKKYFPEYPFEDL